MSSVFVTDLSITAKVDDEPTQSHFYAICHASFRECQDPTNQMKDVEQLNTRVDEGDMT